MTLRTRRLSAALQSQLWNLLHFAWVEGVPVVLTVAGRKAGAGVITRLSPKFGPELPTPITSIDVELLQPAAAGVELTIRVASRTVLPELFTRGRRR